MSMRIVNAGGAGSCNIDAQEILSWRLYVFNAIQKMYEETPAPANILTSTSSGALNTAISNIGDGELLEVKSNATYSPIDIPAGKSFRIRTAYGYRPVVTGERAIRLRDGCSQVIISGLTIENYSLGSGRDVNGEGQAITFEDQNMTCENIVFHWITIKPIAATGSAVLLSYHQSKNGDNYANASVYPDEFSNKIAFIGCNIAGGSSGIEHANILVRGSERLFFCDNDIDGMDDVYGSSDSRGIMGQNVKDTMIESNKIKNTYIGNGEGIKIDKIGSPTYQNSCIVYKNYVHHCIEGIDIDDADVAAVENNTVWDCSTEGISIDDSSAGVVRNNEVFMCNDGIRCENGSIYFLHGNNTYDNLTNNIRLDDGGSYDNTNIHDPVNSDIAVGIISNYQKRWYDINMSLIQGRLLGSNNPTLTTFRGFNTKEFAFAINDEIQASTEGDHGYLDGEDAYFHLHWSTDGTDVNTVKWSIELVIGVEGSVFPGTYVFQVEQAPYLATPAAWGHYIVEHSTPIVGSFLSKDMHVSCYIQRITNGGTDNSDTVFALRAGLHIVGDNRGSLNRYSPYNNRT